MANFSETLLDVSTKERFDGWKQFVQDHRSYIIDRCITYTIPPEIMNTCKYRPEVFLQKIGYAKIPVWIVMWINDINTSSRFINLDSVLIPTSSTLDTLYESYKTYASVIVS